MCRWLAYTGAPIYLDQLLLKPVRSLVAQSRAARSQQTPTNGDGFGVGWYGEQETPGLYRDLRPAWNDSNLKDLAAHVASPLFVAHVRAATEGLVQRTNCHPFRHGRWLFVHNGGIRGFGQLRRELLLAVSPDSFAEIEGTTDSEILFHLALTFGLQREPLAGLERAAGFIERSGRRHGIEDPLNMTVGVTDGRRIFAVRYSSERRSNTLYHSRHIDALRQLHPELERFSDESRAVVSEPLTELTEFWEEIPESTAIVVDGGGIETVKFRPRSA